jgi:hypothetical protein
MQLASGVSARSIGEAEMDASATRSGSVGGTTVPASKPLHAAAEAADRDAPPDAAAGAGYDAAATASAAVQFALFGAPSATADAAQVPPALADAAWDMHAYLRACAARLRRVEAETAVALQLARDARAKCSLLQAQHAALARLITAHDAADGQHALLQAGMRAAASADERDGDNGAPGGAAAHAHAASWLSASSEPSADESDMSEPSADRAGGSPDGIADDDSGGAAHAADSDGSCSSGAGAASA